MMWMIDKVEPMNLLLREIIKYRTVDWAAMLSPTIDPTSAISDDSGAEGQ